MGSNLPPGPFLSVIELRYWIELVLAGYQTNSAAIPMPYPSDAHNEYSASRNLESNILSPSLLFLQEGKSS